MPEYRQWAAALRAGDTKAAGRCSDRIEQIGAQHTAGLKALGVRFPAWMQDVLKSQD